MKVTHYGILYPNSDHEGNDTTVFLSNSRHKGIYTIGIPYLDSEHKGFDTIHYGNLFYLSNRDMKVTFCIIRYSCLIVTIIIIINEAYTPRI